MIKPRIVAIDDEPDFIDMLQGYFTPRGYDMKTANYVEKGLEVIKEHRPDIVLIDLKMPGADGDQVLGSINTLEPTPKIIFITAYDDGGKTRARLMKLGAYACFDKPVSSLKLLEDAINKAAGAQ